MFEKITRRANTFFDLIRAELKIPIGYRFSQTRVFPVAKKGVPDFLLRHVEGIGSQSGTRTLDLGCGDDIQNPFHADELFGVDIRGKAEKNIISAELGFEKTPFPDDYFDYITAFDFIEHVPRVIFNDRTRFPFVELMSEIHRVLKDGGVFFAQTPAYPTNEAFQDPTHINIITEVTFPVYFCKPKVVANMYGFTGAFDFVAQEWKHYHLLTLLKKDASGA